MVRMNKHSLPSVERKKSGSQHSFFWSVGLSLSFMEVKKSPSYASEPPLCFRLELTFRASRALGSTTFTLPSSAGLFCTPPAAFVRLNIGTVTSKMPHSSTFITVTGSPLLSLFLSPLQQALLASRSKLMASRRSPWRRPGVLPL